MRSRVILSISILSLLAIIVSCTDLDDSSREGNEKISDELQEKIKNTDLNKLHVFVKFNKSVEGQPAKSALENQYGILFSVYRHDKSWIITAPVNRIHEFALDTNVVFIRDNDWKDKIRGGVEEYKFEDRDLYNNGTVKLTLIFFKDISDESAIKIIKEYATQLYRGDPVGWGPGMLNDYFIRIPIDKINVLAQNDEVQYIVPVQGPSTAADYKIERE